MGKIVAFSGSLSRDSINRKLVDLAASKLSDHDVNHIDLADYPLPLFSSQTEDELGQPDNATELYGIFNLADGFVISIPEYNSSMPGGFKNMIDWLSRYPEKVFRRKPVLLMATSPGRRGGAGVLGHLEAILPYWGAVVTGVFSLPNFAENFQDSKLSDAFNAEFLENISVFSSAISS